MNDLFNSLIHPYSRYGLAVALLESRASLDGLPENSVAANQLIVLRMTGSRISIRPRQASLRAGSIRSRSLPGRR